MRIVPIWIWAASAAALMAVIVAEIVLTGRRRRGAGSAGSFAAGGARQAVAWVGVYVSLAVACGLGIGVTAGWVTASQFFTGYITEYSLSLDNLFVFTVIMAAFAVPAARQPRVLLFGIIVALVLRSALIVAGRGGAEPVRLAVLPARRGHDLDRDRPAAQPAGPPRDRG